MLTVLLLFFFSKVQARKAFSSYLQRVQQRLLAESRTDAIPAWPDKDNDQMVINDYFPNKWTCIDSYNTESLRIILLRVCTQIPIGDLGQQWYKFSLTHFPSAQDLVIRFLKRAASNLQQDIQVAFPSRQLPLQDRRRILSHQLGEFIHCYDQVFALPAKQQFKQVMRSRETCPLTRFFLVFLGDWKYSEKAGQRWGTLR